MVRVTVWLQLLLVVLILRQSAAVSDQCSKQQEEISRLERDIVSIRDLKNANQDRADNNYEQLRKQSLKLQATASNLTQSEAVNSGLKKQLVEYKTKFQQSEVDNSGLKKQLDEYKTKFQQSEADNSGLKKQLDEYKTKLQQSEVDNSGLKEQLDEYETKFQQSEVDNSGLKKQLDEYKTKFQQSEVDNSGLKEQLETKEKVLKNSNETQTQLQTTIDRLTKILNQAIPRLCETMENVCRYLLEAAKSGDVDTAKILFKCSNDSCTADGVYRNTPLIYAAIYGHVKVVRVLLEGGANVDRANADRRTALHIAALYGHLDVCRLLLDWGAKVDRLDVWQHTPLRYAAERGHLSVVELLVERGADVNLKNNRGDIANSVPLKIRNKDRPYLR